MEDGPFEPHRRVIETNLFGAMFGARAVIPIFKRQGSGTLINVGSALSKVGQPYAPSYAISKFGLLGLSDSLRMELADHPKIHVCSLLPYAFDSQHFEEGANRMGFDTHPMPPQQSPVDVARALVSLAERPRRELHVPRYMQIAVGLRALFPRTVEKAVLHAVREWHFGFEEEAPGDGNLFEGGRKRAAVHGERVARTTLPGLALWALKHFGARPTRKHAIRPHAGSDASRPHAGSDASPAPSPLRVVPDVI